MALHVSRPIKTTLHEASDQEVEAINRYLGQSYDYREGYQIFPNSQDALKYLDSAPQPSSAIFPYLKKLASHPDERVQIKLFDTYCQGDRATAWALSYYKNLGRTDLSTILNKLSERASAEWSQPDAYAWTPLMDRLTDSPQASYDYLPESKINAALKILEEWINLDPKAAISGLFQLKSTKIKNLLSKYPEYLSIHELEVLLNYSRNLITNMAKKADLLPPEKRDYLTDQAILIAKLPSPTDLAIGMHALLKIRPLSSWNPSTHDFTILLNLAADPAPLIIPKKGEKPGAPKRRQNDEIFNYLNNLVLSQSQLRALFNRANTYRPWVQQIIQKNKDNIGLLTYISARTTDPSILTLLMQFPHLSENPSFRQKLQNSPSLWAWACLCMNGTTEEFNNIFPKIIQTSPIHALTVLTKGNIPNGAKIDQKLYKPWLASPDQKIRETAIASLGHLSKILLKNHKSRSI